MQTTVSLGAMIPSLRSNLAPATLAALAGSQPKPPAGGPGAVVPQGAAVGRFSGYVSAMKAAQAQADLEWWIRGQGLTPLGEPVAAQYDAPWKPGFARRNEIMIVIEDVPADQR